MKIELRDVKPLVWRRILVPETVTLAELHMILLQTMGWGGGHLYEYEIAHTHYGVPDAHLPSFEPLLDERRMRLKSLLEAGIRGFTYTYDFGDDWQHGVKLEDLMPPTPGTPLIQCLAGANACPPEDVGGPPGYVRFLAILADPNHKEHAHIKWWIGQRFDPTAFDLRAVNELLAHIKT